MRVIVIDISDDSGSAHSSAASACPAPASCNLEVEAPVTSDIEFKFTWPIEAFLKKAATTNAR